MSRFSPAQQFLPGALPPAGGRTARMAAIIQFDEAHPGEFEDRELVTNTQIA
jgi:hypothetical protein